MTWIGSSFLAALVCLSLCPRPAFACEPIGEDVRDALAAHNFLKAEELARAAVERAPEEPDPQLSLAQVYVRWSQRPGADAEPSAELDDVHSTQAIEVLAGIVRRWPKLARPRVCLLELRQLRGEEEDFLKALTETLDAFPQPDSALMTSLEPVVRRTVSGELRSLARRSCALLVSRMDITVPALSSCGITAVHDEDLEIARERFARAREAASNDVRVAQNLLTLEILLGDLASAESSIEALRTLQPADSEHALKLAVVRSARDPKASATAWRDLLERTESPADARASDLHALAAQALGVLEQDGTLPDDWLVALAQNLMSSDSLLASALLEGGHARAPSDPTYPYLAAQALERQDLPIRAFASLERAAALAANLPAILEIPPGSIDFERGRVAVALGRNADAVRSLERARRAKATFTNIEYLLGRAYAELGDQPAAEREYATCLLRTNNADYHDWCRRNRAALAELPAALDPSSESLESALAQARANEATPAGVAYGPAAAGALVGRLAAAVTSCVARGDRATRKLLIRVAGDGSVAEILQPRDDADVLCFAMRLRGARLPPPPARDWWFAYDLEIGDVPEK